MLGAPARAFHRRGSGARWAVGSGWTPRKAKGRASPSSCRSPPTSLEWWFEWTECGVHNDAVTRVLVIDDEAPIRLLYRVNLEAEGMEVLEARDGERTRAGADGAPGCDPPRRHDARARRLGRGGGTDRRRRDARHSDRLPHRACGLRDRARGLELGGVDYVTKPFNPTELASMDAAPGPGSGGESPRYGTRRSPSCASSSTSERDTTSSLGCSSAWLERWLWEPEAGGSDPPPPPIPAGDVQGSGNSTVSFLLPVPSGTRSRNTRRPRRTRSPARRPS